MSATGAPLSSASTSLLGMKLISESGGVLEGRGVVINGPTSRIAMVVFAVGVLVGPLITSPVSPSRGKEAETWTL